MLVFCLSSSGILKGLGGAQLDLWSKRQSLFPDKFKACLKEWEKGFLYIIGLFLYIDLYVSCKELMFLLLSC